MRSAASCDRLAEALTAEADGVREDDLRVDAGLVHHLEARRRGRTRPGGPGRSPTRRAPRTTGPCCCPCRRRRRRRHGPITVALDDPRRLRRRPARRGACGPSWPRARGSSRGRGARSGACRRRPPSCRACRAAPRPACSSCASLYAHRRRDHKREDADGDGRDRRDAARVRDRRRRRRSRGCITPGGRFSKDVPGVRELAEALAAHGQAGAHLGPAQLRRVRRLLHRRVGVADAGRPARRAAARTSTWRPR